MAAVISVKGAAAAWRNPVHNLVGAIHGIAGNFMLQHPSLSLGAIAAVR